MQITFPIEMDDVELDGVDLGRLSRTAQAQYVRARNAIRRVALAGSRHRLFFVYFPGCGACAAASATVREFAKRHRNLKIVPVNASTVEWKGKWEPKGLPSFVLVRPDGSRAVSEGAFKSLWHMEVWAGSNV